MAELRADEAGHKRTALNLMRKHDRTTWRHAGVELARVPGEEKLRIRKSKENATAEVESDLPSDASSAPEPAAAEPGEGGTDEAPQQQTLDESAREGIH